MQAVAEITTPVKGRKLLSRTQLIWGLQLVIFIDGLHLLLWFFLLPRIEDMLESQGGRLPFVITQIFNFGHFLREYMYLSMPVLLGLVAFHLWAVCQPNRKRRIALWLAFALLLLIPLLIALFASAVDLPVLGLKTQLQGHP